MRHTSLRKRLAREAARLLYSSETDLLFRARQEAQRRLNVRDAQRHDRPSKEEMWAGPTLNRQSWTQAAKHQR